MGQNLPFTGTNATLGVPVCNNGPGCVQISAELEFYVRMMWVRLVACAVFLISMTHVAARLKI